ncbi:MAG: hypothetical protein KA335_04405 [Ramlibacter sp.]|jgi:enoyl-CoA hydratase/carnithine racemase|nr:hypothetical protein [Ramlibacter sp.]
MTGAVRVEVHDGIAAVSLAHPARLSAMTRAMGRALHDGAFRYADFPEHREGISAFLEKRQPAF